MHLQFPKFPIAPDVSVVTVLSTASITLAGAAILVAALACLGLTCLLLIQCSRRQPIQVLRPPIRWLVASTVCWLTGCTVSLFRIDPNLRDQFWYWSAVASCCAPIAVLGAKRPTSRVWTAFIVIPLIAVLGWPAIAAALVKFPEFVPIHLQLPAMWGFVLVLIMGCGNYLGTRFGGSACLGAFAVILNLVTSSSLIGWTPSGVSSVRGIAALMYGVAVLNGIRQARRPSVEADRFDDVWFDFRDAFGIVWSIRIQDRINQTAEAENWCVRLGSEGFVWTEAANQVERNQTSERLIHTLHWLLRRFVEPEWIDRRLIQNQDETRNSKT